mgnify:CR=1 FL=1
MIELGWWWFGVGLGVGWLLGVLHFRGLWRTVRWATDRGRDGEGYGLGLSASLVVRVGLLTAVLAVVWSVDPWGGAAACIGFWGARIHVVRRVAARREVPWN